MHRSFDPTSVTEKKLQTPLIIGSTDALVVIDMQKDFCLKSGKLYVAGVPGEVSMKRVIANTLKLVYFHFGYRVATFDEHPATGHVEFAFYGPHVVMGTKGVEHVDELLSEGESFHAHVYKGEDPALISYSMSTSPRFPDVVASMRRKNIRRIFLCGVAYTHCLGESAIALAAQFAPLDVEIYIVRDATRSVPLPYGDSKAMAKKLALYGVKEVLMSDLSDSVSAPAQ